MAISGGTAFIIGGTGQVGVAAARLLAENGWSVLLAHRGHHVGDTSLAELDVTTIRLDRDDTEALLTAARDNDLVLDTVAFEPRHADQLAQLTDEIGSLVVISSGAVYRDAEGRSLDSATGDGDFPTFPVPITEEQPTIDTDEKTYGPLKAAMERRLLATDRLPVSILRPAAIHGPFSGDLREWYFVKRARDSREHVLLAYDGASRFSTSAVSTIAELVRLCGENPGRRVLNAVDEEGVDVAEIARTIYAYLGKTPQIVPIAGAPRGSLGSTPWSVARPLVLGMEQARIQLGYSQPKSYRGAVGDAIEWVIDVVNGAELRQQSWQDVFPRLARYGADAWFDYAAEDAYLADVTRRPGRPL